MLNGVLSGGHPDVFSALPNDAEVPAVTVLDSRERDS
jgi:hypothetical protein